MNDDPKVTQDQLYAAVAARMADAILAFTKELGGRLTVTEIADALAGIAAGLHGLENERAATVAWLRKLADRIERLAVAPPGTKAD